MCGRLLAQKYGFGAQLCASQCALVIFEAVISIDIYIKIVISSKSQSYDKGMNYVNWNTV